MRRPSLSAVLRLPVALALPLALGWVVAPGARGQTPPHEATPPWHRPSGGPAAAHAHPPVSPQQVVIPAVPPAPPVLPPAVAVPTRPPPPTQPAPVMADAPGTARKTADGLRITFGADRSDLNPDSDAAITDFAHAAPGPDATFTVTAYAAGGDDPSTPRRMSLSRALAVRSALMQAGIASVRIYVKALGTSGPTVAEGPADRVDIVIAAGPGPAPGASAATTAPPPAAAPAGQPPPTEKADP
jgi:outer membrane protein OmpA-like peptidoglycan-associated protein